MGGVGFRGPRHAAADRGVLFKPGAPVVGAHGTRAAVIDVERTVCPICPALRAQHGFRLSVVGDVWGWSGGLGMRSGRTVGGRTMSGSHTVSRGSFVERTINSLHAAI